MDQTPIFDFSEFPTLTTERLVLRAFVPADAPDLFVFRSDAVEQKYNDAPLTDISQAHDLIEWMKAGFASRQMIQWAVTLRDVNRVIGLFGFNTWDRYNHRAEIGYDLARADWGSGSQPKRSTRSCASALNRCSSTAWRRKPSLTTPNQCAY